jgi:hypothetical protein
MAEALGKVSVMRVNEIGERDATVLEHDSIRVMVTDVGGMVPEFSGVHGTGHINAHWLPWFRGNPRKGYKDAEHGAFWKASLLYNIAGSFPCLPNFGPGHIVEGVNMPPHGWTANLKWKFVSNGIDEESGGAWALSTLESPDKAMPLSFKKTDLIIPGQNVHYAALTVANRGDADIDICAGWHNTLGAPFLQAGCRISGAARDWTTPPPGGEFDTTARLALGTDFPSLDKAPLAQGGKTDISLVPGPIGYTDFAAGAIPASERLGWSSLVNPALRMAYVCFFTGQAAAGEDDLILRFNDLWMQYGGRPITPWAPYEGGTDMTYCLGTENSAAAYAYGLEYSRRVKQVLGAPATVTIPARGRKTLRYGVLFTAYENDALDGGVASVTGEDAALVCSGAKGSCRFKADPAFGVLNGVHARHL